MYFFVFEFGAILTFFLILWRERRNKQLREILILAFVYGMLLETINSNFSLAYYYNKDFLFQIFGVPLVIGAGWVIVYYAARKMVMRYHGLRWFQIPFLMALFAVMIDFILDPIAIRLEFWTWRIPLNQEFFGVPYDNFIGWMAAIWTFAFFMNLSDQSFIKEKTSKLIKYISAIVSPLLLSLQITIYLILSALLSGKFSFLEIMGFYWKGDFSYAYDPLVQVWKFYLFALIVLCFVVFFSHTLLLRRQKFSDNSQ